MDRSEWADIFAGSGWVQLRGRRTFDVMLQCLVIPGGLTYAFPPKSSVFFCHGGLGLEGGNLVGCAVGTMLSLIMESLDPGGPGRMACADGEIQVPVPKGPLADSVGTSDVVFVAFWGEGAVSLMDPDPRFTLAFFEVYAVFHHESFALLILPALAMVVLYGRHDWRRSLLATFAGLLAFLLAILWKRNAYQIAFFRDNLWSFGLFVVGEIPGSSITELAVSTAFPLTWELSPVQMDWSVFDAAAMSLLAVLSSSSLAPAFPSPEWQP